MGEFLLDPTGDQFRIDPYPMYEALRERDPVHHNPERGFWALSRFEDVQWALRDWQTFSSVGGVELDASLFGQGDFIVMDPPDHDVLRRLVSPRFQAKAMGDVLPVIEAITQQSLLPLLDGEPFDAITAFAQRIPAVTICTMLGLPAERAAWAVNEVNAMMTRHGSVVRSPEVLAARSALESIFVDGVKERTAAQAWHQATTTKPCDIMTDLAEAVHHGELTMEDIPGLCLTLIAAGTETTAGLIAGVLHGLACGLISPSDLVGVDGQVRLESLDEYLRFDAPIQWLGRTTTTTVHRHGRTIPAGAKVLLLYGSANRDPRRFTDPDHLHFDRPVERSLTFGDGIHFCLGRILARLEAQVALTAILRRWTSFELTDQPRRFPSTFLRTYEYLPLRCH
jgi:cytochrome P450